MVTVPLFHVFGFVYSMMAVALGQTQVVMMERFEAGRVVRVVERFGVTNLAVVPSALIRVMRFWEEEGKGVVDLKSLERVSCGGATIGVGLIRRFMEMFPRVQFAQVTSFCWRFS